MSLNRIILKLAAKFRPMPLLAMDPLTAALNFLCSPAGQKLCDRLDTVLIDIINKVHELHAKPAAAPAAEVKSA